MQSFQVEVLYRGRYVPGPGDPLVPAAVETDLRTGFRAQADLWKSKIQFIVAVPGRQGRRAGPPMKTLKANPQNIMSSYCADNDGGVRSFPPTDETELKKPAAPQGSFRPFT